jgi:hypothetical protein
MTRRRFITDGIGESEALVIQDLETITAKIPHCIRLFAVWGQVRNDSGEFRMTTEGAFTVLPDS